jgi:hypothetical protein
MYLQPDSTIKIAHPDTHQGPEIRLQGVWLILARVAWVVLALLGVGLPVVSLPSYYAYLHITDPTSVYGPQLTPGDVRELHNLGLSLDFYAWLNISAFLIFLLVCVSIGLILFLRRSDDHLALLASLSIVFFPLGFNTQIPQTLPSVWMFPIEIVIFCSNVCLGLFIYLFPSGRFVPRWTRWLMVVWVVYWANNQFFPNEPLNNTWLPVVPLAGLAASLIALQVYRYRHVSTLLQRQQTKWVVFGIAVTFGSFVVAIPLVDGLFPLFFPMGPLVFSLIQIPLNFLLLLYPLSIVFAILRNRLWEIDRLINRALIYGTLTVSLALVYVGLIIGLQALLGTIIRQDNAVAVVVSTLVIYALFQPLRRRIQNLIDRRFYRRKYDAARTLAAFSTTLRGEVDLSQLSEQLLEVVEETMQPAHVSLWLNQPTQSKTYHIQPANLPS